MILEQGILYPIEMIIHLNMGDKVLLMRDGELQIFPFIAENSTETGEYVYNSDDDEEIVLPEYTGCSFMLYPETFNKPRAYNSYLYNDGQRLGIDQSSIPIHDADKHFIKIISEFLADYYIDDLHKAIDTRVVK